MHMQCKTKKIKVTLTYTKYKLSSCSNCIVRWLCIHEIAIFRKLWKLNLEGPQINQCQQMLTFLLNIYEELIFIDSICMIAFIMAFMTLLYDRSSSARRAAPMMLWERLLVGPEVESWTSVFRKCTEKVGNCRLKEKKKRFGIEKILHRTGVNTFNHRSKSPTFANEV